MTKQQRTGLILGLIGIILFLISFTIDTPWNSGESLFDSSDNVQENIRIKRFFQFSGIALILSGGILYLSKSLNTKMLIGSILGVLGVILAIWSLYDIITLAAMDDYELMKLTKANLSKMNSNLGNISNSELRKIVKQSRTFRNISNVVTTIIGIGLAIWGRFIFKKGEKQMNITEQ